MLWRFLLMKLFVRLQPGPEQAAISGTKIA
jgi:hypothetical protein